MKGTKLATRRPIFFDSKLYLHSMRGPVAPI